MEQRVPRPSDELRAHFRYPEDLFRLQAYQYANYHVTDPTVFYQKQDFWQVPEDPTRPAVEGASNAMDPYYLLMKLPGDSDDGFFLVSPFVPENRQNMVGWMAVSSDPDSYGRLVAYRFPTSRNIDGPSQVFNRIKADPTFAAQQTLLGQSGSKVIFGDFLVIPIDDSLLYVQPIYVQSSGQNAIPELTFVVVVNGSGGGINLSTSLAGALDEAVSGEPGGGGGGGGTPGATPEQLLAQALNHFAAADAALRRGDLATYQQELQTAQSLVEQAQQLLGGSTGTPSASPSASPSPSG
jgi:uncharacterized membrane protein (UPF0182 family)